MRQRHRTPWSPLIAVSFAALLALGGHGCGAQDSGGAPPVLGGRPASAGSDGAAQPGATSTLTLAVPSPATITAGSAGSVLTATLLDANGAPLAGQPVDFSASPANAAQFAAATALTDASGVASTTVSGLRAGALSVTARATGGASDSATVTVLGPVLSVALAPAGGQITASTTQGAGATFTVTVADQGGVPLAGQTVSFATTQGVLDAASRKTDAQGKASVKLTSQAAGQAGLTATVLGATTGTATVTVVPAALQIPLTVTTSANRIPTTGSATVTIQAKDQFGNPVDTSVDLVAELAGVPTGTLSPSRVDLIGGTGTAVFEPTVQGLARIRALQGGFEVGFADVSVEVVLAGEPAQIRFAASAPEITVKGSGGTESSAIQITVLDVNGNPIDDSQVTNNLEVRIAQGAGGGESLDGIAGVGQVRTLSTSQGAARVEVQSGTRPGTVQLEVKVTKGKAGTLLTTPLVAAVPRITIRSGPPASLFLSEANAVLSPGLRGPGTITHDYLATVSDLWGNAVPDGTIVFFSQFLNIKRECRNRQVFDPAHPAADPTNGLRTETCLGAAAGTLTPSANPLDPRATFTSGSVPFTGVLPGDTLVIITEANPNGYGGYRVSQVDGPNSLRLDGDVPVGASGLEWALGNNANLGGGVFTTEDAAATEGGVARWSNTYAGELINSPVYIFAEAEGGTQGHARIFRLMGRADAVFEQFAGPEDGDSVGSGTQGFGFLLEDASTPTPYAVAAYEPVLVSATGGALTPDPEVKTFQLVAGGPLKIETSARSIATGDSGGAFSFRWTPPLGAPVGAEFTITVAGGGARQTITVTIQ